MPTTCVVPCSVLRGFQLPVRHTVALLLLACTVLGCGDEGGMKVQEPPPTLQPGATIPLDTTVRIDQDGDYPLADGATTLTTRCHGSVAVSFTIDPGPPETNTCDGDGSSSQTNIITGATSVTYTLAAEAFADVTLR